MWRVGRTLLALFLSPKVESACEAHEDSLAVGSYGRARSIRSTLISDLGNSGLVPPARRKRAR
jgi:hypothetical protein